jgi:hypothetical protein
LIVAVALLTSCAGGLGPLKPAWQQDPHLYHHGLESRVAQNAQTPHMVARILYASPDGISRLLDKQGDVPDAQRGFARMGDGTLELAVQDVASGKWVESYLCGGHLFVSGLPNQAYRLVLKNLTPLPLELGLGVDGRDLQSGGSASFRRGGWRIPARGKITIDHGAGGALMFKALKNDSALHDLSPQGRTGLIQIAVYLASDAPSTVPEKLRGSQVAPLGLLPMGVPEQYR